MENEDKEPEIIHQEEVEIYSKLAIRGFSIFFSAIFGGVLLMQNLKEAGYKRAANNVLAGSIAYTILGIFIASYQKQPSSSFAFLFNIVGGVFLSDFIFPRYFPDNNYYPKKIWKPLIISIAIVLPLFLVMLYSAGVL